MAEFDRLIELQLSVKRTAQVEQAVNSQARALRTKLVNLEVQLAKTLDAEAVIDHAINLITSGNRSEVLPPSGPDDASVARKSISSAYASKPFSYDVEMAYKSLVLLLREEPELLAQAFAEWDESFTSPLSDQTGHTPNTSPTLSTNLHPTTSIPQPPPPSTPLPNRQPPLTLPGMRGLGLTPSFPSVSPPSPSISLPTTPSTTSSSSPITSTSPTSSLGPGVSAARLRETLIRTAVLDVAGCSRPPFMDRAQTLLSAGENGTDADVGCNLKMVELVERVLRATAAKQQRQALSKGIDWSPSKLLEHE